MFRQSKFRFRLLPAKNEAVLNPPKNFRAEIKVNLSTISDFDCVRHFRIFAVQIGTLYYLVVPKSESTKSQFSNTTNNLFS